MPHRESRVSDPLAGLAADYPAWWVDLMGEHNHVGGIESTRWLLQRSGLGAGLRMLDCGAFVGGAARYAAAQTGAVAVATDVNRDFLAAGRRMAGGAAVQWLAADNRRLPFADGAFDSVWCMDSYVAPRELTRVARAGATLCLCCDAPDDSRGGADSFFDDWRALGWELNANRDMTLAAIQGWRGAEQELVGRRQHYEPRYGKRTYLAQLDFLAELIRYYERGGGAHGLFVFRRRG